MELYYYPSTAAMVPHILLEELGVPYRLTLVDRQQNAHKSPDYLKLNPNGLIPVLVDGDLVLYETAAICLHLADTHPEGGLLPALGTPERAHAYKWLMWLADTLQPALMVYWYPERWAETPGAVAEVKVCAEQKIGTLLDQLDTEFARPGHPWLLGTAYTLLDPYVLTLCRWTRFFPRPARSLPHLGAFLQRMLERPAVQRMYEQQGIRETFF
ncbi:glutathione S-transferase family protein [Schlegelella sp. S2-27]|uniref:Glutathione S-transferase family protein n=1 Tax=Caldimonas mangrovi TaxID=2944811 RepID=A0ABT0YS97_9BURK|nr:glutathione S-transferase family protein [Caldimonas mangrovi]MCM5681607.1 glutathione S-transferase family protein [Caldimonas mangrovi]